MVSQQMSGRASGWIQRACVGLLLLAQPAASAHAADEVDTTLRGRLAALEAAVRAHAAAKDAAALVKDGAQAVELHREAGSDAEGRKAAVDVLGKVLRSVKEDADRKQVFEQLVRTQDPDAGRLLRPYVRQANVKEADPLLLAAMKAAGALPCTELVDPLLQVFEKSKHLQATTGAMEALGGYRPVKSRRERILETVLKEVQRCQPGGPPGMRGGAGGIDPNDSGPSTPYPNRSDPAERWTTLAPLLPKVLNRLTGQDYATADLWFQMFKQVARTSELFAEDPAPAR